MDQHRAVRAMVGVRMVWVSPEQRRKGLATKLLDAARYDGMLHALWVGRSGLLGLPRSTFWNGHSTMKLHP